MCVLFLSFTRPLLLWLWLCWCVFRVWMSVFCCAPPIVMCAIRRDLFADLFSANDRLRAKLFVCNTKQFCTVESQPSLTYITPVFPITTNKQSGFIDFNLIQFISFSILKIDTKTEPAFIWSNIQNIELLANSWGGDFIGTHLLQKPRIRSFGRNTIETITARIDTILCGIR